MMSTSIKISLKNKTVTSISHVHKKHKKKKKQDIEQPSEIYKKNDPQYVEDEIEYEEESTRRNPEYLRDEIEFNGIEDTENHVNYGHESNDQDYDAAHLYVKENDDDENDYVQENGDDENDYEQENEYLEENDDENDYVQDVDENDPDQAKENYADENDYIKEEEEDAKENYEDSIDDDYTDNVLIHREDPDIPDITFEPDFDSPHISDERLTGKDDCSENPNFAVIVDFMERFSAYLSLKKIPIRDLQNMICDTNIDIHMDLVQLHMDLLKKIKLVKNNSKKIYITKRSWETALVMFCNGNNMADVGTEVENNGYSRASINIRLDILKHLMESQFEWNEPLRFLVDDLPIEALRIEPTGRDINGMTYWTQIDEVADIRVYSEDYTHDTWGSIARSRGDVVRLMRKLKEDTLYKREVEVIKAQDEQSSILDLIVDMEYEQEEKVELFNTDYKCEVCAIQMSSKLTLMEHYSGDHMKSSLRNKFADLNEEGICKICKFDAEEEDLLWVHIGTLHEKVNVVLKENGFKQVGDKGQATLNPKTGNFVDDNGSFINGFDTGENNQGIGYDTSFNENNLGKSGKQIGGSYDTDQIPNKDTNDNEDEHEQIKNFLEATQKNENKNDEDDEKEKSRKKRKKRKRSSEWCLVPMKKQKKGNGSDKSKGKSEYEDESYGEDDDDDEDYSPEGSTKGKESKVILPKYEEMLESNLPCKKCNQVKDGNERVYACSQCNQGWHQNCTIPTLLQRPTPDWLCPLCHHISLVNNLEKILKEFDSLVEELEELRRATLIENQTKVSLEEESQNAPETVQEGGISDRESSEGEADSDDDWLSSRTATCTCGGVGNCLFCKRRQGCTCEGSGTCRLCMSMKKKIDPKNGLTLQNSQGPAKMSTTEMFLLTGKTRQVEVQAHERLTPAPASLPDDGFVFQGNTRGKGAKAKKVKAGKAKPPMNIGSNLPPGITILNSSGTVLDRGKSGRGTRPRGRSNSRGGTPTRRPNGIHPTNRNQGVLPRRGLPIPNRRVLPGQSLSSGNIDVIDVDSDDEIIEVEEVQTISFPQQRLNNQGYTVKHHQQNAFQSSPRRIVQPRPPIHTRPRHPIQSQPRMPLQRGMRSPGQQLVRAQPRGQSFNQGIRQPVQRGVIRQPVQRGGIRQPVQRGGFRQPMPRGGIRPPQRGGIRQQVPRGGIRQPVQRGGIRQPMQRGGRVIIQNGRTHNSQMNQMNPQPRGVRPAQRRPIPIRRGVPVIRGPRPVQTVIYPQQGGMQSNQRGAYFQNGVSAQQRATRGMPAQRRMISNPVRTIRPAHVRGRGMPVQPQNIMMGTRPQRGMMNRGRQPVINRRPRARGRPTGARGNPRIVTNQNFDQNTAHYNGYESNNSFSDYDDDVIIPTLNPDYQAAPDFDIIADDDLVDYNDDIVDYNGDQDDNIMTENYAF